MSVLPLVACRLLLPSHCLPLLRTCLCRVRCLPPHAGLSLLRRCSSLSSLNLAVCREVTDAGLQAIIKLPLRTLDLTFVDRVSDKGISLLTR